MIETMNRSLYSHHYDALRLIVGKIEQSRRKVDIVEFVEYCRMLEVDPHEGLDIIISEVESQKRPSGKI